MLDPITIGLAFTAAQSAVSHIKKAIALGKDIHGLAVQFNSFFDSADTIHRARTQVKIKAATLGKTDAELGKEALQIAMHSNALREAERELKDMIIWQLGKPHIWEDMIRERTRLFKERAQAERDEQARQLAHKKKMANYFMNAMYFMGFSVIMFCLVMAGLGAYGAMEDKRIYEEKVQARRKLVYRQHQERLAEEKKELLDYSKN